MQGISVTLEELLALRHVANQIYLPAPKLSTHSQYGNYQSPIRGRGMDFVENRIYQPGDDIRGINWAVTARTGRAHSKVYQQERERPIYLILDFNDSMFFGTKVAFKSVIASRAAALIAWAALRNGDRIGAVLVKETIQQLPPCHNKQNLINLFKNIVSFSTPDASQKVDVSTALNKLKRTMKSGSLIYLLSDFYNFDNSVQRELQHLSKHHEVINILIYDTLEKKSPIKDKYLFHDFNGNQTLLLDTHNKNICQQYNAIFNERLMKLKKLSYATGMHLVELETSDDLIATIRQVFRKVA